MKISGMIMIGVICVWVGIMAATVCGFLGAFWWVFDLFSHFRMQYCILSAGMMILCALPRRMRPWAAGFALPFLINGLIVSPLFLPASRPDPASLSGQPLRIIHMNVLGQNSHYQKALELIHANNPDLILIEELTFNWMENLGKTLETDYPHQILEPRNDNFGIGLFSKIPLEEKSIEFIGEANVPTILAVINYSGTTINLIGTHPMPPAGSDLSRLRNDQFDELGRIISEMQEPIIVIGDLNATPWSHHFRKFLRETGLKDSGRGRGWQPTWPAPIPPLRIPIDHALYKGDLITTSRTVLPEIGSDHLPLLVEFQNRK